MLSKDSVTRTDLAIFHSPTKVSFDLSIIVPTRNEAGNVQRTFRGPGPGARRDPR